MKEPKILFYDIETSPLQAWIWQPGKQFVGHKQLVNEYSRWGIICISYCWNDGKTPQVIGWDYEKQSTADVIKEFDEIIKQADITIGKNSNKFDSKMINTARMFAGLPGMPEWMDRRDDLELQMRKYFRLPSQSLDYISNQLGYGGKVKMEMQDWIDICVKNERGPQAYNKMLKYCKKDIADTRALWNQLSEHFTPKFNMGTYLGVDYACKWCGSGDLKKNGGYVSVTKTRYQHFFCNSCNRGAGKASIKADGTFGRIG